jgi:uncharacterized coiled-coil DUF342 family protein
MTQEDRNDIKRHFDVVVENLRSDFRLVAEGVAMNAERLDRVEGELRSFRDDMFNFRDETRSNFGELFQFRDETRSNFGELFQFRDETRRNFDELFQFRDETRRNFGELFQFRDETRSNFGELRSDIKPSNMDLDRRLTTLERAHGRRKARM